jgi:uncharacterized protein with HEPN domain
VKRQTTELLQEIIEAAERAVMACPGGRAELLSSWKDQLILTKLLELMGEAATKIDKEFRAAHPAIPWRQMIGLRNHTVHNYIETDFSIVWLVVEREVPAMIPELKKILAGLT